MSIRYIIKEGFEGFRRARVPSFISITTVAFMLILVGIFLVATVNLNRLLDVFHRQVDVEVFIDNSFDDEKIRELETQILKLDGIDKVEFISKEMAAQFFKTEFGDEIFEILEDNPLPSSFRVELDKKYRDPEGIQIIATQLKELPGVDDIVYRRDLLILLNQYARYTVIFNAIVGAFVCLGSLFMISNTTRLIIMAKRNIIEAMRLVGATSIFIRTPFLIEGVVQGILGGAIAAATIKIFVKLINVEIPNLIVVENTNYLIIILIGVIFGFLGSYFATTRFIERW